MSGRLGTAWCWVTVWWRRIVAWLREEYLAILIVLAFAAPTIYLAVRSSRAADALASQFDGTCDALAQPNLDEQLALDYVFIFYFAATVVVGLFLWWRNDATAWRRHRLGLITPLVLWFLTDLAENVAIHNARAWCAAGAGDPGRRGDFVYALATAKWVLLGIVVVGLLYQIGWRTNRPKPPPQKRCQPARRAGTGICCSGGGIRSASFSLGALHGLGRERLRTARYLAAVSGGGYAAAGMTIRAAADPEVGRLPFSDGSEELERLRARTSYLGLNGQDGRVAVARALATIAFNLLILYLVVFAIGRPLGWIIQSEALHPELRAATPLLYDVRIDPLPEDDDLWIRSTPEPAALAPRCAPETVTEQYWTISLWSGFVVRYAERETAQERDLAPRQDALVVSPGQLNICDGLVTLAVQPRLFVGEDSPARIEGAPAYFVDRQISLRVAAGNVAPLSRNEVRQLVEIATKPSVKVRPPSAFTESITIDGWMWGVFAVPFLLASAMLALNVSTIRGKTGGTLKLGLLARFLVFGSALTGLVLILAPWLVQELPGFVAALPSWLPGGGTPADSSTAAQLPWIVTAVVSGGLGRLAASRLVTGASKTKRSLQLLLKVAAFALLVIAGVLMATSVVQQAALNGPVGTGSGSARAGLLGRFMIPDVGWWGIAIGGLLVLKLLVPTHAWSLNPLYRDRLASAFLEYDTAERPVMPAALAPDGDGGEATDAECGAGDGARTQSVKYLTDIPHRPQGLGSPGWPELVICCAVNLNDLDRDAIPAGRWADSFTFSAAEVGAPSLGYLSTADYLNGISARRGRDLTIASLVATSGAAVSSAAGKKALGAIGGLLAALNVRLGLWVPNLLAVRPERRFAGQPGWPYLLRELFGKYSWRHPFLYITDGGHWENLGLVELMRRGCEEIYVISAAGDGMDSFATLGEAIALTREQTGIEIRIDPSPLRPAPEAEPAARGRRLLRRRGAQTEAVPMATKPYVVGFWEKEKGGESRRGRVLFVEANVTADMPWDVHAFAEGDALFPDHSTSDQFFRHSTFEAYRRLGQYQMSVAVGSPEWADAKRWVEREIDARELRRRLAAEAAT